MRQVTEHGGQSKTKLRRVRFNPRNKSYTSVCEYLYFIITKFYYN